MKMLLICLLAMLLPLNGTAESGMELPDWLELSGEGNTLHALMTLTERLACKPNMLLEALAAFAGIEAPRAMVVRNGLLGLDESGALAPLENL